jgi:hypothetical protein
MKIVTIIFLLVLVVVLGTQINSFLGKNRAAQASLMEAKTDLVRVKSEFERLKTDLDFFLQPANMEKELRARFNFKLPEEKLMIIVPEDSGGR